MTAVVEQLAITTPGVYQMSAEEYHADPVPGGSLSASAARKLLPPSCPALYRYEQEHPPAPRKVFDEGHAAHRLVLGTGPELVRIDADEWRSNAVKAEVAEARDRGAVPLKPAQWDMVHAMAEALRAHPLAAALFAPTGKAEQSLFWTDGDIWRRARLDWLPYFTVYDQQGAPSPTPGYPGRLIIPDYKTCRTAAPDELPRTVNEHGYHQQAAWYIDGVKALMPAYGHPAALEPAFVFVLQEKTPPYLVTVAEPDAEALRIGRSLNRDAMTIYRECVTTGRWPGYSDDVVPIGLPPWVEAQHSRESW